MAELRRVLSPHPSAGSPDQPTLAGAQTSPADPFTHFFQAATRDSVIKGPDAALFLRKSGLPDSTLRQVSSTHRVIHRSHDAAMHKVYGTGVVQIWNEVDSRKQGFLEQPEFTVALQLVSLAQQNQPPLLATLRQLPGVSDTAASLRGKQSRGGANTLCAASMRESLVPNLGPELAFVRPAPVAPAAPAPAPAASAAAVASNDADWRVKQSIPCDMFRTIAGSTD